jgi:hypothetical protein
MRRRTLLVVVAGLAAVVAAGVVVLWPRNELVSPITRENYERVRLGMSLVEVMHILGPPGDNRTGDTGPDSAPPGGRPEDAPPTKPGHRFVLPWDGDRASILVFVGPGDRVAGKQYLPVRRLDASPLDNLLWRAKRQWHRWFP